MVPEGQLVLEVTSGGGNQGLSSGRAGLPALAQALLKPAGSGQRTENRRPAACREQPWVCVSARCPGRQLTPAPDPPLETVLVPPGAVLQASGHGIHSS